MVIAVKTPRTAVGSAKTVLHQLLIIPCSNRYLKVEDLTKQAIHFWLAIPKAVE